MREIWIEHYNQAPKAAANNDNETPPNTCSTASNNMRMRLVDIGINLTHSTFRHNWKQVIQRAVDAGVDHVLLTGTSIASTRSSLALAQEWRQQQEQQQQQQATISSNKSKGATHSHLYVKAGIHPHNSKHFDGNNSLRQLETFLQHPLVVAVGECGLDFNRNFSSREEQIEAFQAQVALACQLNMPLFVHEREAHTDVCRILDQAAAAAAADRSTAAADCNTTAALPPVVIHCFTGIQQEAAAYIERGFYIGFTGTICKHQRGAHLRELLPTIPLDRIMIETDAPFMGFVKGRRNSEPADVVGVAQVLSETLQVPLEAVCAQTTQNAVSFFRLEE